MSPPHPAARTEDLVQFLLDHGFVPRVRDGASIDFSHSGGASVTVPSGQAEIPPGFAQSLLQQFHMMELSGVDELTRLLLG